MNPRVFSPYRSIGPLGSPEHEGVPFLGSGPYELLPGVFRIVPSGPRLGLPDGLSLDVGHPRHTRAP